MITYQNGTKRKNKREGEYDLKLRSGCRRTGCWRRLPGSRSVPRWGSSRWTKWRRWYRPRTPRARSTTTIARAAFARSFWAPRGRLWGRLGRQSNGPRRTLEVPSLLQRNGSRLRNLRRTKLKLKKVSVSVELFLF